MSDWPVRRYRKGFLLMVRAEAILIFVFLGNAEIRRRHRLIGRPGIGCFFGSEEV